MKICVLIKQVASEDSVLNLNSDKKTLNEDGLNLVSNEPDTYGLEEALQIKEKTDGEVAICTVGNESARQVIKDALAKGADRGIFISDSSIEENDPLSIAKSITAAIKNENFDLILSGLQSNDNGHAQVGLLVAELLSTSHASLVMGTEIINENTIKVKQELENGWFQWSELDLPASLTIQSGINTPRYATLKGIMSVKNKTVDDAADSGEVESYFNLSDRFIPQKTKETIKIEGSTDEVVEELMDVLKNKIKVI
tara:strand:+ start:407 stop:1171 length:765 start_codon:yes stop_codon:yes gene_type:complete